MKVLVTGGSGMVGRNLINLLEKKSISYLAPSSSELNLLDQDNVDQYLSKDKPDFVVHCAGRVGGIQANIKDPVGFLVENTEMGKNLLLSCFKNKVTNVLNLASSCMYPRNRDLLVEDMILTGELEPTNEGYALAKIFVTKLANYISKTNEGFSYKTIIPCNIYGKYDKFDPEKSHLVPAIIHKVHTALERGEKSVLIWGDGTVRREFMYSEDLADFIYYALSNFPNLPELINVGLGKDYSILEYYQTVAEVLGYKGEFEFDTTKPVGMKQKLMANSLTQKMGWSPSHSLIEGIKKTYEFYKEEAAHGL